jgi:hypothetical protein
MSSKSVPVAGRRVKLPAILTWENPVRSGTVLAEILGVLFVLSCGSLLRLGLKLVYWSIALTGGLEFVTRQIHGSNSGVVSSYRPSRFINVNQAVLEKYTSKAISCVSCTVSDLKKLLDAEDLGLSLAAFLTVYFAYLLIGCMSIPTILILFTVGAFAVPPLYLKFQKEIDVFIDFLYKEANKRYGELHGHVKKAAAPHLEMARGHLNTLAAKVGYNRGFPATDKSKNVPVTETPGPAAKIPEPVTAKQAKLSEHASSTGASLASEASHIIKNNPDVSSYESVPTLIGNVSLDPHASSKPLDIHGTKPLTESVVERAAEIGETLTESVDDAVNEGVGGL